MNCKPSLKHYAALLLVFAAGCAQEPAAGSGESVNDPTLVRLHVPAMT